MSKIRINPRIAAAIRLAWGKGAPPKPEPPVPPVATWCLQMPAANYEEPPLPRTTPEQYGNSKRRKNAKKGKRNG